jgi:hypothetical protein
MEEEEGNVSPRRCRVAIYSIASIEIAAYLTVVLEVGRRWNRCHHPTLYLCLLQVARGNLRLEGVVLLL